MYPFLLRIVGFVVAMSALVSAFLMWGLGLPPPLVVPIFFGNLVAGLCIGWYARAGLKRGRAAWPGGAGKAPRPTS